MWWVATSLLEVTVLFEVPVTVTPKLFKGVEHLMLNEPIHCLIIEIKHKNRYTLQKQHISLFNLNMFQIKTKMCSGLTQRSTLTTLMYSLPISTLLKQWTAHTPTLAEVNDV